MINLTSLSQVRSLVQEMEFHPSRTMGQNFLIDRNILNILLEVADLREADAVLEVGPGLGVVTEQLVERCQRVIAVEKDARLHRYLEGRLAGEGRLRLIHSDALELDIDRLLSGWPQEADPADVRPVQRVVSNLPYSVGTRILVEIIRAAAAPERIVVTVQEEVAGRITAAAGAGDRGMLGVWCQALYDCETVKVITPTCFWPKPEIRSALVRLSKRPDSPLPVADRAAFFEVTRKAFMHRRKQMATILSQDPSFVLGREEAVGLLERIGAEGACRPGDLDVGQWLALARDMTGRQAEA